MLVVFTTTHLYNHQNHKLGGSQKIVLLKKDLFGREGGGGGGGGLCHFPVFRAFPVQILGKHTLQHFFDTYFSFSFLFLTTTPTSNPKRGGGGGAHSTCIFIFGECAPSAYIN